MPEVFVANCKPGHWDDCRNQVIFSPKPGTSQIAGYQPGDLFLMRVSGARPKYGVRGIWAFKNIRKVGAPSELPPSWNDADYEWILSLTPLVLEFRESFNEEFQGRSKYSSKIKLHAARIVRSVVRLTPSEATHYLEPLIQEKQEELRGTVQYLGNSIVVADLLSDIMRASLEKAPRKSALTEADMFQVGRIYSRSDIHKRYGGQEQGGISTPSEFPVVLLFTEAERGAKYGYRDGWESDGTFRVTGEGQVGDMEFTPGNVAVRDHAKNGEDLHVFQYVARGKVRYVGQMLYASHELVPNVIDRKRSRRTVIAFHLVPIQMSGEVQQENPVDSAGRDVHRSWYWEAPLHEVRAAALDQPQREMKPQQALRNVYHRSEAVRVAVLRRANGHCEGCGQPAPFKARDGRPYLEPHHTHRLSDRGPDQPKWVIAVCPTCHRRAHYAEDAETYNEMLKSQAVRLDEHDERSS